MLLHRQVEKKIKDKIVIETLRPENMVKNRKLSQAIGDVSFGEIARQFEYKARGAPRSLPT